MRYLIAGLVTFGLVTGSVAAQTPPPADLQLLPVTRSAVPGANGSLWVTEHYAHNHSDSVIWITNNFDCQLSAVHACDTDVWPRDSVFLGRGEGEPYELWGVVEGDPQALTLTSFVRNVNGEADPWGTALPVAKGDDFRSQPLHIAPVPADPAYRVSLRAWVWSAVDVTLIAEIVSVDRFGREGTVVGAIELQPVRREPWLQVPVPLLKGFEAHDVFGGVAQRTPDSRFGLRLRIPSAPDAFVWGFASVTHNVTHHVTIFEP